MDQYIPADVTAQAQAISRRHAGAGEALPRAEQYGPVTLRTLASGKPAPLRDTAAWLVAGKRIGRGAGSPMLPLDCNVLLHADTRLFTGRARHGNACRHPPCASPRPALRPPPCRAVHPRPVAAHGRDLRVKTRTRQCIQLDQDELDLGWALKFTVF